MTQEVMEDAVMAADGHTYERSAISEWSQRKNISPICGDQLAHTALTQTHNLKKLIRDCAS